VLQRFKLFKDFPEGKVFNDKDVLEIFTTDDDKEDAETEYEKSMNEVSV